MEDLVSGVHIVGVFYLEDIERLLFQQQATKREKGSKNVSWSGGKFLSNVAHLECPDTFSRTQGGLIINSGE